MSLSVAGRVAIVTGAGQGVGLAIARHLAELRMRVVFADPNEAALSAVRDDYAGTDADIRIFAGRITEHLGMANLLSVTLDAFDRVDVLVNVQGDLRPSDPLDPDSGVLDDLLRQNVTAPLRLSQMVARRMIAQAHDGDATGAIVTVLTRAAGPAMLAASIAGAAQEQAVRGLALSLAPHRIRVNGVRYASVMSTRLQAHLREHPGLRDRIVAGTPLGRIAAPDELADAVHYLASDGARFVTGQILTIDGGRGLGDPINEFPAPDGR
ncbi:SDR family NAD(P)-dependent oxidoreductase [Paracoccus sp. (in: a-proteobacteria)]|uniref:SDR family NAD(P)-dependent oxidoreductase n=1 Tax=Paracoccus sp. TaxID=267 RepID=UPI0026DF8D98|nr:SDR family oxidoreductase [Paracoccus sp. (in: a-proteobacteria)]MDO5646536.1 SDR family oxidoreductase [Paracoccus sp. (in: a-proteobacteria)]